MKCKFIHVFAITIVLASCSQTIYYDSTSSDTALIIYPGGLVKAEQYGALAKLISIEAGVDVYIARMPFKLAIFGKNRASRIISRNKDIEHWYVSGHSLGGVIAAAYLVKNCDIDGLILMASYPMENKSLANSPTPVLSISGSKDGLTTRSDILNSKYFLPESTVYIEIDGANHTQFYSSDILQSGDLEAGISEETQHTVIANIISDFINQ